MGAKKWQWKLNDSNAVNIVSVDQNGNPITEASFEKGAGTCSITITAISDATGIPIEDVTFNKNIDPIVIQANTPTPTPIEPTPTPSAVPTPSPTPIDCTCIPSTYRSRNTTRTTIVYWWKFSRI